MLTPRPRWPDPNAPRADVDAFVASLPPVVFCAQCSARVDGPPASNCCIPDNHNRTPSYVVIDPRTGNAIPTEPPHEAPPVENGPSLVCNACGVVRVGLFAPFCKGCLGQLQAAGVLGGVP